jgi:hypothetical protein
MYGDTAVNRPRLLSEILNAATGYVEGLADAAVQARLQTLLGVSRSRLADSDDPIGVASDIVREAQAAGRAEGLVSFYGDLADRALFATIARSAGDLALIASPAGAISAFTRELLGFAIDHLVSRDLTAHLGAGSLIDAGSTIGLRRDLVTAAQGLTDAPSVVEQTLAAVASPRDSWHAVISSAWKAGRDLPGSE